MYLKTGKYLGAGAYKRCYTVKGRRVALIQDVESDSDGIYGTIRYEMILYKRLKKAGFPVPTVRLGKVREGRCIVDAIIMPRYDDQFYGGNTLSIVNNTTVAVQQKILHQLWNIYLMVEKTKLAIVDIQYLVNYKTGELVIHDPYRVIKSEMGEINMEMCIADIQRSIDAFQASITEAETAEAP